MARVPDPPPDRPPPPPRAAPIDRRRPGRRVYVSPELLPLLRCPLQPSQVVLKPPELPKE